jgi:hypothetical protein
MIEGALGTKPLVILVGLRFFQLSNQVIQSWLKAVVLAEDRLEFLGFFCPLFLSEAIRQIA